VKALRKMSFATTLFFAALLSHAAPDIVVGQVASLSGSNGADLGQGLRDGALAYFAEVNAAGGVGGRKLRLVSRDDKYDANETVAQTKALIEAEKPVALLGYRGTANTIALVKDGVLQREGIALVGTLTGATEVQGAPNIFHARTSYRDEITQLVYQLSRIKVNRISVLYADDAFGRSGLQAVTDALRAGNQTLVESAAYDKAPEKVGVSIKSAATKLGAKVPQAIVMVAVGEPVYDFIRAMRESNGSIALYGLSVVNPDAVIAKVGAQNARGIGFSQVFPFPYVDSSQLIRDYRIALKRHVPAAQPSYFSLEGYVYARVLTEALRRAGGLSGTAADRARVLDALTKLPEIDMGGFFIKFYPDTRNGSKFTELTIISSNGRLLR
jgi:branched-chain amino acid transport system substrate-binding protein